MEQRSAQGRFMATDSALKHIERVRENNGIYIVPALIGTMLIWGGAAFHWLNTRDTMGFLLLAYIGLIIGLGVGGYIALPDRFRPYGRKITMFLVGVLLLLLAILSDHGNMQIEGLFFALLAGAAPYILVHYLIAKLVGPLIFGRLWCGWACWYGMIFDMMPYPFSFYRRSPRLGWLRYGHFLIALALVALLWYGAGFDGALGQGGLYWFLLGVATYYLVGIVMALALKDNRAFCKYLCPITVPLKLTSRFSLLKIKGTPEHCADCEACVEMCPMNIRIKDYVQQGERVLSTECVMCLTCINVCPHNSLKLSLGLDAGGKEYWDLDPTRGNRNHKPNVAWVEPDSIPRP
jgi:polyferredoxin